MKRTLHILFFCAVSLLSAKGGAPLPALGDNVVEIKIEFPQGKDVIDPDFGNNREELDRLRHGASIIKNNPDMDFWFKEVKLRGAASLEDSYETNSSLSQRRLRALESLVRFHFDVPDSVIVYDPTYIPWDDLADYVRNSDLPNRQKILEIIAQPETLVNYQGKSTVDSRINRLRALDNGQTWNYLYANFFPEMRFSEAVITFVPVVEYIEDVFEDFYPPIRFEEKPKPLPEPEPEPETVDDCYRRMHLKTNLLGWGLGMVNAAVEFDFAPHWSAELPVYYSAWNYFTYGLKFRTLDLRPEIRYWLSPCNEGFFAGAHFGLAWYDFAFKGEYRYQDRNGNTPALGGGITLGYRMPISANRRWHIEFGLSGGIYRLDYDKFINVPNGRLVGHEQKTYYGLDGASVSITYSFGLQKKGGNR